MTAEQLYRRIFSDILFNRAVTYFVAALVLHATCESRIEVLMIALAVLNLYKSFSEFVRSER